jgi:2-dehydropantoate 2-reductase
MSRRSTRGSAIEGPVENSRPGVPAFTPGEVTGTYRRIVLAVKAHHTEGAMRAARAAPGAGRLRAVGAERPQRAGHRADRRRERTMGCFVNFGADWLEPGEILFGNRAAVVVGELDGRPRARQEMFACCRIFEPDAVLTDNIWGYLWGKLGYGAMLFATALTNASMPTRWSPKRAFAVIGGRSQREVMAVAARAIAAWSARSASTASIPRPRSPSSRPGRRRAPTREIDAPIVRHGHADRIQPRSSPAKTHSGIWRDLAVRKRKTEVDAQIAAIIAMAPSGSPRPPRRA